MLSEESPSINIQRYHEICHVCCQASVTGREILLLTKRKESNNHSPFCILEKQQNSSQGRLEMHLIEPLVFSIFLIEESYKSSSAHNLLKHSASESFSTQCPRQPTNDQSGHAR